MLFNSAIFLFIFLPILLGIYFLSGNKYRNLILLISSILFYSWGEQEIVLVMLASTVADYMNGILIDKGKRKLGMVLSLITNLGFLAVFKYADFAFENFNSLMTLLGVTDERLLALPHIALPIGISFYTFQTLSYTIDVYRGKVKANYNFIDFATYVTLFPQLIAGPIVRYSDVNEQLQNRTITVNKFAGGVERFIIGLGKKMIIANTFALLADNIFAYNPMHLSTPTAWIGILAYSFQIYYDFSAYSDMAIGLGKMFGFDIPENFNYPYISKSIKEFWRRWHISLSSWFRDYLYIPLGGNRHGPFRTYLNLFIVFFITGMWHGASWNFIVWGLFHGTFLVIERLGFDKILEKIWTPFQHAYMLIIVLIGWVFFRADNLTHALNYISSMFGHNNGTMIPSVFVNAEILFTIFIAVLFSTPVFKYKDYLMNDTSSTVQKLVTPIYLILLFGLYITAIGLIAADSYNPFIYFRF